MRTRWLNVVVALMVWAPSARLAMADSKADARRYFQRGMSLIDAGRYEAGIVQLKKAYAAKPHPNVLFNIARAYAAAGSLSRAIDSFERYLDSGPADAERVRSTVLELKIRRRLRRWVNDGMRAIKRGRYIEGVGLLERAYAQRPHANIMFNIARAYEQAGDYRQAILSYRRYLRARPKEQATVERRISRLSRLARLARLEARQQASAAQSRPPSAPRPPAAAPSAAPSPPVGSVPPPTTPGVGPKAAESTAPPALDDQQLGRLAAMIAERMQQDALDRKVPASERDDDIDESPLAATVAPRSPESGARETDGVALEAKGSEVYEDVVYAASRKSQAVLDAPNAVTILTEEDIRLSGARSIPDLLRRVPGMDVMAMSYSDYNVALRGFNRRVANKVLLMIDGRTAYEDFVGGVQWRGLSIDLIDIERIEVVRGPGSAIYGAYAYTGTINIITKRPDALQGSTAQVHVGNGRRLESVYQYGGVKGPVGVRFSIGYDRGDKYELEFDPNRVDFTTKVEDPDVSLDLLRMDGRAEYRLSPGARLYMGGGLQSGSNELYGVASQRNQQTDGEKFNVRAGYESKAFTLRAFYSGTRLSSTPQFFPTSLDDLGSTVRFDLFSVQPIYRPEFELGGRHALVIGGEYRFKYIEWDYLVDQQQEDHFALFFQDIWSISDSFSINVSARLDLHPLIGPLGSPRVAFIYKPSPNQALRLSVGTAFRQPTMAETYLELAGTSPVAASAIQLVGFRDLDPERIASVDVGYRYRSDFVDVEAVGYLNRITNLIVRTPLQSTGADARFDPELGAFVVAESLYVNDTRAFLSVGAELSARVYPVDGVDVGANYTLQYIFDEENGDRFTDSPIHKVSVWGYLRTEIGLDLGLSGHFVSAQDWVEPEYDPNDPTGFNTDPLALDASVLMIGRVGYRLFDDQVEIAISGVNLLDFGDLRHREHPFGNRLEARVVGSLTARF